MVQTQAPIYFAKRYYRKVTHCLFDLDGTVLDSEIIYHEMIKRICGKFDKKYSKPLQKQVLYAGTVAYSKFLYQAQGRSCIEYCSHIAHLGRISKIPAEALEAIERRAKRLICNDTLVYSNHMYGLTDEAICKKVVAELKLPISADECEKQLSDLARKMLPGAPLQKGAERLLTHLYDYKVPMALATNSTEQAVRLHATSRPKLFGMFHHMVSATDPAVDRGKPNPDIYLVAAARFPDKPKPKQCLVFEDSTVGVKAGKEAGMQVVMIPDPRIEREQTRYATIVIRSLLEFKPELFGLPPFKDSPRDMTAKIIR